MVGAVAIGPTGLGWPESGTVLELRSLRVTQAVAVGAALGLAGVLLQSLLRNPLASPDLLGVSGGAALGVAIESAILVAATGSAAGAALNPGGALLGAAAALAFVALLGQRGGLLDPISLVLVGVTISVICGSGVVAVQHTMPDRGQSTWAWTLGSLSDDAPWPHVLLVLALCAAGVIAATLGGRTLDAASTSDDEARSMGVRLGGVRAAQLVGAGLLTAGSVSLAGPIGFIGLVCPHAARLMIGPAHGTLAPASAILGAATVTLADAGVRGIDLPGGRLPLGVITTAVGGPLFVWLLRRELQRRSA